MKLIKSLQKKVLICGKMIEIRCETVEVAIDYKKTLQRCSETHKEIRLNSIKCFVSKRENVTNSKSSSEKLIIQ